MSSIYLNQHQINDLTWEWVQCEQAEIDRMMQEKGEEGKTEDHKHLDVKGTTTSIISLKSSKLF